MLIYAHGVMVGYVVDVCRTKVVQALSGMLSIHWMTVRGQCELGIVLYKEYNVLCVYK